MIWVCTSSPAEGAGQVGALFTSVRRFHPEWKCCWAVADGPGAAAGRAVAAADLVLPVADIPAARARSWIFQHARAQLTDALVPLVLRMLLDRPACDLVFFCEPDVVLFSPLDDLVRALDGASVGLLPRHAEPGVAGDAAAADELSGLRDGLYNVGFAAVGQGAEGRRFAEWWAARVLRDGRPELGDDRWTDQRWLDLAPGLFDRVAIIRSPRYGVGSWNVATRRIGGDWRGGFQVNGEPLGFYHFHEFAGGAHRAAVERRAGGAEAGALLGLLDWYKGASLAPEAGGPGTAEWAFQRFSNGVPVTAGHRLVYRSRPDLRAAYPDPFAADGPSSFLRWCEGDGAIEYPELFGRERPGEGGAAPHGPAPADAAAARGVPGDASGPASGAAGGRPWWSRVGSAVQALRGSDRAAAEDPAQHAVRW